MTMASDSDEYHHVWDAQKTLDLYVHDYLVEKKLHKTAAIFRKEANVGANSVALGGFLHEWWTIFYDFYASRQIEHQDTKAKSSVMEKPMRLNEQQNKHPFVPHSGMYKQKPVEFLIDPSYKLGQDPLRTFKPNLQFLHRNRFNLSSFAATNLSYPQQQTEDNAQHLVQNTIGNSLGGANHVDTTSLRLKGTLPKINFCDIVNSMPKSGCRLEKRMQTPSHPQQFQMLKEKHHQSIVDQSLALVSGDLRSSFPGNTANVDGLNLSTSNVNGNDSKKSRKKRRLSNPKAGSKNLVSANAKVGKPVDENVESFLSTDDVKDDNKDAPLGTLKRHYKDDHKGFTFEEIGCLCSSKSKVVCCNFSSDGRFLASAGHDKKVFIWNMETLHFINSSESHSLLITDVRFRPNSTIIATSSFDRTVQIWNAAKPSKSLFKLLGHADQVMALDFHPRKVDLLCSCDSNDEIRLWNVNRSACLHVYKGATKQVRFQPRCGKLLATASGNSINVIDIENNSSIEFSLKGHAKEVLSLCWDTTGKYIASVSEDSARIWSLAAGGSCMNKLLSNGNKFQSCTFHPGYSQLLTIGGYQSLELWNTAESRKTLSVPAHSGLIAALADSIETEMIASASHDQCVKLWK